MDLEARLQAERAAREAEDAAAAAAQAQFVRFGALGRLLLGRPDVRVPEGTLRLPVAGLHLDGADVVLRDALDVGGTALPALLADPPAVLRGPVRPCAGLRLRTWCALRPAAWPENRGGVRFVARAVRDGRELAQASVLVDPHRDRTARRWVPLRLELPASGAPFTLELATEVPGDAPGDFAWAAWGDPVLLAPAPGRRASGIRQEPTGSRQSMPPLVSILLPVHDPEPALLAATLDSVRAQTSDRWQLCVCDDGSGDPEVRALLEGLEVVRHDAPRGISAATTAALGLARGEYVATLDHDDVLHPEAIARVGAALAADPRIDVLHTDNDKRTPAGTRFAPALKPGWSPDLLRAVMYTLHLGVYRRALVEEVGGWRSAFDGAQDWDLVLRLADRGARVAHLPAVLHSWTAHEGSTSFGVAAKPSVLEAGRRAVDEHLRRTGVRAHAALTDAGRVRVVHEDPPPLAVLCDVRDAAAWAAPGVTVLHARPPGLTGLVLVLEERCVPACEGWHAELAGPLAEGAAAVGAHVVDAGGRTVHGGVALPAGVPLPVHPLATEAEELTFVTNRSALTGAVALRAQDLDGDLLQTTLRLRGRKLLTPWARLEVVGAPRGVVADPGRLAALDLQGSAPGGRDLLYSSSLVCDRAAHLVPRALG